MGEVLLAGLLGGFIGGFSKFVWERWLPDWLTWRRTQRVDRERELSRIRSPAIRAFSDLHFRLLTVARTQAANYKYVKQRGKSAYYIDSTAYLVAHALAWQEILRRRMDSYDYATLYARLEKLTDAMSHGYEGFQIFRLQQIEIGQRLITSFDDENATCLSFSEFLDMIDSDTAPDCMRDLRDTSRALLEHPVQELERAAAIDGALFDVIDALDRKNAWRPLLASEPIDAVAIRAEYDKATLAEQTAATRRTRSPRARRTSETDEGHRAPTTTEPT